MNRQLQIFSNGFVRENPLLVLNIGLCSSLGVTTSIFNGLGMGMGMLFVLVMSEIVISGITTRNFWRVVNLRT